MNKEPLQYPAIQFLGFKRLSDMGAYAGYMAWEMDGKEGKIPVVFTDNDLERNTKVGLISLFSQLFDNALNSAHDVIDEKLKRGFYADSDLRMDDGL